MGPFDINAAKHMMKLHSKTILMGFHGRVSKQHIAFFVMAFAFFFSDCQLMPLPPDREVIRRFHNNKAGFERLVQMDQEDHGAYFFSTVSMLMPPGLKQLSANRMVEYQTLLSLVGARNYGRISLVKDRQPSIVFNLFVHKVILVCTYKDIAYLPNKPKTLRATLDKNLPKTDTPENLYLWIEGNWYIAYFRDTLST